MYGVFYEYWGFEGSSENELLSAWVDLADAVTDLNKLVKEDDMEDYTIVDELKFSEGDGESGSQYFIKEIPVNGRME